MVGCIKFLGESKWKIDDFKNSFKSKKRSNCAPPAPPCGLYLTKISYWLFHIFLQNSIYPISTKNIWNEWVKERAYEKIFFKVLTGDLGGDCDAGESGTVGMYAAAPDITFTFE